MTVGILTITHENIGKEIYATACLIFSNELKHYQHIGLNSQFDLDALTVSIQTLLNQLDQGQGVLILTDVIGASPCNLANRFNEKDNIKVVSGVNLAMMLNVMNKQHLALPALAKEAVRAGRHSINEC